MRVSFRPIIGSVLARGWHGAVRHSSYGRGASTDRAVSEPIARQLKTAVVRAYLFLQPRAVEAALNLARQYHIERRPGLALGAGALVGERDLKQPASPWRAPSTGCMATMCCSRPPSSSSRHRLKNCGKSLRRRCKEQLINT